MRKIFLSISIIFCGVVLCSANLFGIDNTNSEKKLEDESSGIRIRVKSVFDAVEIDDDSFYAEVNGMIKHIYATDSSTYKVLIKLGGNKALYRSEV